MRSFQLGAVEVTKVVEWQGDIAPARTIIPASTPAIWRDNRSWLAPDHWNPETDAYHAAVQTWVLRSEGKVVLVDTGVGNDRDRPQLPLFDHLATPFLDRSPAGGRRRRRQHARPLRPRRRGRAAGGRRGGAGGPGRRGREPARRQD